MNEQNTPTPKMTPENRELLLKYFQSKPPEKPLNEQEFSQVKEFIDRRRGGLTREAYQEVKEDKELVKAASISQAHKDHRIMDKVAPEMRDTLLKALTAQPGEKNLTKEEFRSVAIFLDRVNGGVRKHAFAIFKDDKEIVEAATKHREQWRSTAPSRETIPTQSKKTEQETVQKPEAKKSKLRKFVEQNNKGMNAKSASPSNDQER